MIFRIFLLTILVTVNIKIVYSQSLWPYDTDLLSSSFHKGRRSALRDKLPENSAAILFAASIKNRSNDVDYEFHQCPNFYYLTGFNEPNAVLLIFKNAIKINDQTVDEIIFVPESNPDYLVWNGRQQGTKGVEEYLGFENVYNIESLTDFPLKLSKFDEILIYHNSFLVPDQLSDARKISKDYLDKISKRKNSDYTKLGQLLAELREIKERDEMLLLRKAIDITCLAQIKLMETLNSDMHEYEAEAVIEHIFKNSGAEYPGFPSIIGGGENSCILHYVTNRKQLNENELLVVDIGAEYHAYTADVTRTIPVSGTYTDEQKIIYNIVLEAQKAGIDSSLAGKDFRAPYRAAKNVIAPRLVALGIIKSENEYKKYFMHGVSHYLGLDVHDVGTYGLLKPGSIITVEPGIYIPANSDCDPKWWNIGVRIEDDVLITEGKPEILSDCVPKTIEEIEGIMAKH